jgi:hypothetical protein
VTVNTRDDSAECDVSVVCGNTEKTCSELQ